MSCARTRDRRRADAFARHTDGLAAVHGHGTGVHTDVDAGELGWGRGEGVTPAADRGVVKEGHDAHVTDVPRQLVGGFVTLTWHQLHLAHGDQVVTQQLFFAV